ncbi:helix-turn-helix transcriptional regulator [Parablautia sp. Marseille-Q6255]|uniref:helix-turn-helix transcriptional regulator n=1 Tax=Parablautia sp. Marseille-Q6255 TaxID=3039593 RepID=UPI0024BC6036|nr:helix-turn-helix transcriptional regulator [Parablautia sp. Marseille-Q6255]
MNRIRELREEKGITQVRLSIELEVSQETISAYEMGKYFPSVKSLLKLREIFNANIDYILGLSSNRYEPLQVNSLKEEEIALIQAFRKLDLTGREKVKAYIDGYLAHMQGS